MTERPSPRTQPDSNRKLATPNRVLLCPPALPPTCLLLTRSILMGIARLSTAPVRRDQFQPAPNLQYNPQHLRTAGSRRGSTRGLIFPAQRAPSKRSGKTRPERALPAMPHNKGRQPPAPTVELIAQSTRINRKISPPWVPSIDRSFTFKGKERKEAKRSEAATTHWSSVFHRPSEQQHLLGHGHTRGTCACCRSFRPEKKNIKKRKEKKKKNKGQIGPPHLSPRRGGVMANHPPPTPQQWRRKTTAATPPLPPDEPRARAPPPPIAASTFSGRTVFSFHQNFFKTTSTIETLSWV